MITPLRRVGIVVAAMFLTLLISASNIQVLASEEITNDDRNTRKLYESYAAERGQILAGGVPLARSIPVDNVFEFLRTYPYPELYAPVVGYYTLNQGNQGIESALNPVLTGRANSQVFDQIVSLVTGTNPQGASVALTLDPVIQQAAWDALGDRQGSVVALDPTTGRVLAMVSKPSYDPNLLAAHSTAQVLESYTTLNNDPQKPLANRAIAGDLYFPGSVFKTVVTAAALESGRFSATSEFENPAELTLPLSSSTITNSGGRLCGGEETVTLENAYRLSCNIPYAELALELGEGAIGAMSDSFGFGATLEIPLRVTPSVFPRGLDQAELMLSSFGQFDVRVTPLQVAMVSAAIANQGTLMTPNLVDQIIAPDLRVLLDFEATEYSRPISPATAKEMTRMMVGNVSRGVASNAAILGIDVAGKTGTAQVTDTGAERYFWFSGFAPAEAPRIVVAVVVEGDTSDGTGNSVAAPIAKAVMEAGLKR
jgi:peptidoglycan glycosyltransferase